MTDIPPKISFATRLRNSFLTGVLILAPVTITMWLVWSFLQWADSWVKPYIPARYDPEQYFDVAIPGFGLLIAVIGISESILNRMPLVRPIYKSIKQLFESVLKEHSNSFKKVGLIEFPSSGTWAMVFVASEAKGELAHRFNEMGQQMVAVFLPPTPVPTAGFLLFVPKDKIVMLDMTPEDAAKLLISGGLVAPDFKPPKMIAPV